VTTRKRAESTEREQRLLAEALQDATVALTSTLNFEKVLDRILENISRVLPMDSASIMIVDDQGIAQVARYNGLSAAVGSERTDLSPFVVSEVPNLNRMAQTGEPLIIADTKEVNYWKVNHKKGHSYLGSPIKVRGKVVGFINLDYNRAGFYTLGHAERLQSFVDLAAIAIENAQMFKRMRDIATTDDLTGLNNRRNLFTLAKREVNRAIRTGRDLSLFLIDLDHFKEINDTYGHQMGDEVLKKVAALFQTQLRNIDIPGRYGGDEFFIILPDTGASEALILAARLLHLVREMKIMENDRGTALTLSIGIACLQNTVFSFSDLLRKSDQALYLAKQNGRDRIEIWQA
jgi:diguanylate cyclase (GGDEF)-like protein